MSISLYHILKTIALCIYVYINLIFQKLSKDISYYFFRECSLNIDSHQLSCSINTNKKVARKEAATVALEKLQKRCYTVKVRKK